MKYFTNRQVTELYAVSYDAVRKWIQSAQNGKVDLQIGQSEGGKWQIANTTKNIEIIEQLVARGKKHKNSRAYKVVQPRPEFYELYSPSQQLDIISSIESYREIPLQYSYFDGGADYWDAYSWRLINEQSANSLNDTIDLIDSNRANIERFIKDRTRVNVIDLGVGNGLPVRGLLQYLLDMGLMGRYVGIDISPQMLNIAEENIKAWFGDDLETEMHVRDIAAESFKDLLVTDYLERGASTINLVLLLGGTMNNFRQPSNVYRFINASMLPADVLIYSAKLDTASSRQHFDFNTDHEASSSLAEANRLIIECLGFTPDLYEVEQFYDPLAHSRFIRIRMKVAISIHFKFRGNLRPLNLDKGDTIAVWRARHVSMYEIAEQFEQNGFDLLETSVASNRGYMLAMASVTTSTK